MYDRQLDQIDDEPLPPPERSGVTPLWRVIAVFSLLGAVGLLCMVIMLLVLLAQQAGNPNFNNPNVGVAPPAVWNGGMAVQAAAVEEADPANPPYPVIQDLRPAGTFPLPGDNDPLGEKAAVLPRREFVRQKDRIAWTNPEAEAPDRVLISPIGANMAYTTGNVMMAGPVGMPQLVMDDVPGVGRGFGGMGGMGGGGAAIAPGGMMGGPAQGPPRQDRLSPRAVVSGWSADSNIVTWTGDDGCLRLHNMATNVTQRYWRGASVPVELALPLAVKDQVVAVRYDPRPKAAPAAGARPAPDLTEVVIFDAEQAAVLRTLVPAGLARWQAPALSPDGKRLAIISNQDAAPDRWRVFVLDLDGAGKPVAVSPPAARYAGVCWTTDGKALVYARNQSPTPADHGSDVAKDACDLYLLDLATKEETRLSRGGGFTSPSVAQGDELFFLAETRQEGAAPAVELIEMKLQKAREFVEAQEKLARDQAKAWTELADQALKEAGVAGVAPSSPEQLKKMAEVFTANCPAKLKADPPVTAAGLDRQRREVQALDLAPPARERVALLLGAVEFEFLRGQDKAAWHLRKESAGPVRGETPFGFAFNPFRPLEAKDKGAGDESPSSLAELLYRAEGRTIVLSNDAKAAKGALDDLTDPNLARGSDLLKAGKVDEADRVLLEMTRAHVGNSYLTVQVALLLQENGRTKALADLLRPMFNQGNNPTLLPRDARLHNLLGIALLDSDANQAAQAFQNALRCDLKCEPAYLNLAQAYQKANRNAEARWCLRRYLKLFPEGALADDARRRMNSAGDDNRR